ncbi:Hypothetical predicted protein [Marmota monax]|uniref:Cytokine-like nuclear factor N-PAC n=1 Tax=Marmota monax TaxID=9995 RepID=A0A5E4AXK7_MARMO|nr:putative oxidoreductase GLYR1 [Marmota monax]VTJ62114.1 Hypothetical predicted protein [Marmota monax]
MAAVSLRLGDLVWGKLGRYPPWPGKIVNPPKDLKKPRGKKCFFVKFFGTEDHAWIKVEQLKPYHAHKEEMIKINKGKRFQQAVDAVEEFLRRAKGKDQTSSHTSADDKSRRNSSEERSRPNSGDEKRKLSLSEGKVKKNVGEGKKRVSSGSAERGSKPPLKRAQEQSPRKRGRPPKDEKDLTIPESSTVKGMMAGPMAAFKWQPTASEPVKDADPHFHHFLLSQTEKPAVCYQAITKKLKICEEETGSTSIQAADSTAVNGSITPTDKKIGFLGLGLMGSGIVSNLLKMGHTVTVWNRTAEKCDLFIQEGARLGRTPAEVVSTCDITFACVSDPKAAKDLVLGPSGVLQGIRPGKCYVDMSTVDADTVTELAQVAALFRLVLDHPFSGCSNPRLAMHEYKQFGYKAKEKKRHQYLGTSLSSLSTIKASASLNSHETLLPAERSMVASPTVRSNPGCQFGLFGLSSYLLLSLAEYPST